MLLRVFLTSFMLAVASPALPGNVSVGDRVEVNGLEMYYEVTGDGDPLIVIHGGIAAIGVQQDTIALLAEGRQVIAPHLQGHGFTEEIDRPFSYETMADDIAALIEELELGQADILGYSLGGGVAIQLAIRHPELVDRLVVVSATMRHEGSYPEVLAVFDQMVSNAPVFGEQFVENTQFEEMFPDVDWVRLFRKTGEMLSQDYDWSADVARIEAPTMLVFADADSIRTGHMVEFWKLIGGGGRDAGLDGSLRPDNQLAIIPGATHYDIFSTTVVAGVVIPFLDDQ